jgi:hypothetical protein
MKSMLLAAAGAMAALALTAVPAAAQEGTFNGNSAPHRFVGQQPFSCFGVNGGTTALIGARNGDIRGNRNLRRVCNSNVVMDWYGGEWALYNNRTWEPDSYNDWWHDRPDRAYPAWMRHNQDCQRMWFAGDTLRC